ncbi:MAG TPA: hypothetical protein VE988_00315 [Gemmataceae bacterium]|nr:hypothetical protein [Gemmataceae bacterium]
MASVNKAAIGVGAVVAAVIVAYNYDDVKEMGDMSQQIYLRLYGESIYEYHALTGEWPSKVDDLAKTSLPVKYPHWWKAQLDIEADVIVWPKDLKPDPKENAHAILCYHNKGLDAEMGRMWVCWGDLRTECITPEDLQKNLNKQNKVEKSADGKLIGVWQKRNDAREIWTVRTDGTVRWYYQGVPAIGIADSIVTYTYRADPTKSPAHLDLIHHGVMGTSCFIYEVTEDELRIGNRPDGFGPKDMYYNRVRGEPAWKQK